jgi:hypothetical protein
VSTALLKIYGERNSGTNYLKRLIRHNLDIHILPDVLQKEYLCAVDSVYVSHLARQRNVPPREVVADLYFEATFSQNLGWKHALVKSVDCLQKYAICSNDLSFVTLTKNPYSWLLSFYRRPYHQYWRKKPDFHTFLTSPWKTVERENAPREFANPVELWNQKNASYLQLPKRFSVLNLRYEDLLGDPIGTIEIIASLCSCRRKGHAFTNIGYSTKNTDQTFAFYQDYYLREQWKKELLPGDIKIINEFLNDDILEAFQYQKLC